MGKPLRRKRAGEYETRDGRFSIEREPAHGSWSVASQAGKRAAWWVYDNEVPNGDALNVNDPCWTLAEARDLLARQHSDTEGDRG